MDRSQQLKNKVKYLKEIFYFQFDDLKNVQTFLQNYTKGVQYGYI